MSPVGCEMCGVICVVLGVDDEYVGQRLWITLEVDCGKRFKHLRDGK